MVARVDTVAFYGIQVLDVDVQVQMPAGLPSFPVVGLPNKPFLLHRCALPDAKNIL